MQQANTKNIKKSEKPDIQKMLSHNRIISLLSLFL